eukprot:scaffold175753_cov63-Attheya_sp.AAC.8
MAIPTPKIPYPSLPDSESSPKMVMLEIDSNGIETVVVGAESDLNGLPQSASNFVEAVSKQAEQGGGSDIQSLDLGSLGYSWLPDDGLTTTTTHSSQGPAICLPPSATPRLCVFGTQLELGGTHLAFGYWEFTLHHGHFCM